MRSMSYKKGYRFEYRVKRFLEERGWFTMRSPASKGVDIIAMKGDRKLFIQCKKSSRGYIYVHDLGPLIEAGKREHAEVLLVYGFERTPIYVKPITEDNVKIKKNDNHMKLEEYLGE